MINNTHVPQKGQGCELSKIYDSFLETPGGPEAYFYFIIIFTIFLFYICLYSNFSQISHRFTRNFKTNSKLPNILSSKLSVEVEPCTPLEIMLNGFCLQIIRYMPVHETVV